MESKNYFNMYSYLKIIMELLNKEESVENYALAEIFNDKISNMTDEEIKYMYIYSALFETRLLKFDDEERMNIVSNLYECYIKSMIINFSNNEIETVNVFYNLLNEKVKMLSGFYGVYNITDDNRVKKIG